MSDLYALTNTAVALLAGFIGIHICKHYMQIESASLLLGALLGPGILFLALSGRIVEFKGLGVEAAFQQTASREVNASVVRPEASSAEEIQERGDIRMFFGIGSNVVFLQATRSDKYPTHKEVFGYAAQIYPGLLDGTFEMLVITTPEEHVLGYFQREFFLDLLRIEFDPSYGRGRSSYDVEIARQHQERLIAQLEQTRLWDIVDQPELRAQTWGIRTTVRSTDTNAQALSMMREYGLNSMVVVDNKGDYAGIVRREDLVADLLLSLDEG